MMMQKHGSRQHIQGLMCKKYCKKSAIIVWTAISASVLLGFAALAVDLGYIKVVKGELQNAVDASAMAGVSGLFNIEGRVGAKTQDELVAIAKDRATEYCAKNYAAGQSLKLAVSDVTAGYLSSPRNLQEAISIDTTPYNTLRVVVRMEEGSINGPVGLFFAKIWGKNSTSLNADATAMIDDRLVGYKARHAGSALIPVSVRVEKWNHDIVDRLGEDNYGYDPITGEITDGPDGVPEISIYPEKQTGNQPSDGAGNLGLLNFGNGNNGVPPLEDQILNGLNDTALTSAFGSDEVRFRGDNGEPITHGIDGTPGLKNILLQTHNAFQNRLGDVIGFFNHVQVQQSGSNAVFTLSNIQFGRLIYVNPKAAIGQKSVVIQPVAYAGDEIITGEVGPHHVTGGRIVLVR